MSEHIEFPVIQVLAQSGSVTLANVSGAANPVAVLDDTILDKLAMLSRNAKEEALKNPGDANVAAVLDLCATLDSVLATYAEVRNKYFTGVGGERQKAALLREFEASVKALNKLQR